MRTTRQLSITLPTDMADALRARVSSGEYASESEAVRDGLRALFAREQAVEAWPREEVATAYDSLSAEANNVVTPGEIRTHLAARHAAARSVTKSAH